MTPKEMVAKSNTGRSSKNWYDSLPGLKKIYVNDVISEMKENRISAPHVVSFLLKEELDLSVSRETIARKIKELLSHAQKET